MKHLIVVDMQNDFCTGSLKNDDAVAIIPFIKNKVEEFIKNDDHIMCTMDTHSKNYMNSLEGKHLPVEHCIKGTWGWDLVDELKDYKFDYVFKPTFGYLNWKNLGDIVDGDDIYLCGVCTDICVISNALAIKAAFPKSEVYVYKEGCAGLTKEKHEHALDVMASCQCNII